VVAHPPGARRLPRGERRRGPRPRGGGGGGVVRTGVGGPRRRAPPAYGLAKLALGGNAPTAEATAALERLLADAAGTPAPERARAALHLAALRLREGDRVGAGAALDGAALDPPARAWAARAAAVAAEHRGAYRAVQGAPASLQSASDDDPPVLSPAPPPRPVAKATAKKATAKKRTATTRTTATKRKTTSTRRTRRR
jgi:hypothetical protein